MNEVIPARIKLCRKKEKLNQQELADKIGVSVVTIKRWENVKSNSVPTSSNIIDIAKVLNTTVAYLLGETNNSAPYTSSISPTANKNILALAEEVADENTDLTEPITIGRKNNMYIIKDGGREYFIPNDEEGRKIFLDFLRSSFNGIGLSESSQSTGLNINNGTNSSYNNSTVHNGTPTIAEAINN